MILKSTQRRSLRGLADHLTNTDENEQVTVLGSRDLAAGWDTHGALDELRGQARQGKAHHRYLHAMISPDQEMTPQQWDKAWQTYEKEFGLENQPYHAVQHAKGDRSVHQHRVYHTIDADGRALNFSWSKMRNEKVARVLEHDLGHEMTAGRHNTAVMKRLRTEGRPEVADWMERHQAHSRDRPSAEKSHAESQQDKRFSIEQVSEHLTEAYQRTKTGPGFQKAVEEQGYRFAQGRRGPVVLDPSGAVHNPSRRIDADRKEVRGRMAEIDAQGLPTVDQARAAQKTAPDRDNAAQQLTPAGPSTGRAETDEERQERRENWFDKAKKWVRSWFAHMGLIDRKRQQEERQNERGDRTGAEDGRDAAATPPDAARQRPDEQRSAPSLALDRTRDGDDREPRQRRTRLPQADIPGLTDPHKTQVERDTPRTDRSRSDRAEAVQDAPDATRSADRVARQGDKSDTQRATRLPQVDMDELMAKGAQQRAEREERDTDAQSREERDGRDGRGDRERSRNEDETERPGRKRDDNDGFSDGR